MIHLMTTYLICFKKELTAFDNYQFIRLYTPPIELVGGNEAKLINPLPLCGGVFAQVLTVTSPFRIEKLKEVTRLAK